MDAQYAVIFAMAEDKVDTSADYFLGNLQEAEAHFNDMVVEGTYPYIFICRVVKKAEARYDIEEFEDV